MINAKINLKGRKIVEDTEKKKVYLRSYQSALQREHDIEQEIEQLRTDKMFPGFQLDRIPGTETSDLSAYAAKIDEMLNRLKKERLVRIKLREKIELKISEVPNETERAVLLRRYIQGMLWEEICDDMGYSWKQIHRIHQKALDDITIDKNDIE